MTLWNFFGFLAVYLKLYNPGVSKSNRALSEESQEGPIRIQKDCFKGFLFNPTPDGLVKSRQWGRHSEKLQMQGA